MPLQSIVSNQRQNSHYQMFWLISKWVGSFGFGLDIGYHNLKFSNTDWVWSSWKNIGFNPIAKFPYPYATDMHCNLELCEDENDSIVLLWRSPSVFRRILFHLWNAFASTVDHSKIMVYKALLKCFFSVEVESSTSFCLNSIVD